MTTTELINKVRENEGNIVATYNADAYCVETAEQVEEIVSSIEEGGWDEIERCSSDWSIFAAQLELSSAYEGSIYRSTKWNSGDNVTFAIL